MNILSYNYMVHENVDIYIQLSARGDGTYYELKPNNPSEK